MSEEARIVESAADRMGLFAIVGKWLRKPNVLAPEERAAASHVAAAIGARHITIEEADRIWLRTRRALTRPEWRALDDYCGTSCNLNTFLRSGADPMDWKLWDTGPWQRQTKLIDKALSRTPLPYDIDVTRNVELHGGAFEKTPIADLLGTLQRDSGYMSTSLKPDGHISITPSALIHLRVPAGTHGLYLGDNRDRYGIGGVNEQELLLARGLDWMPEDLKSVDGKYHIYGRILQAD